MISVRNSIWIGLEKTETNFTLIENENGNLFQEKTVDELTYTDGATFDVSNRNSYLGANILRGPCFGLSTTEGLQLRDYKCSRELGYICLWKGMHW